MLGPSIAVDDPDSGSIPGVRGGDREPRAVGNQDGAGSPRTRHARDRMKRGITGRFLCIGYLSSYYEDNNRP